MILFIDFSDCLDLKFRCEVKIILSFAAFLLDISYFRLNPLSFALLAFLMDFSFLDLFLTLGIGFPLYPKIFLHYYSDPAVHQDPCGKCRIQTRGLSLNGVCAPWFQTFVLLWRKRDFVAYPNWQQSQVKTVVLAKKSWLKNFSSEIENLPQNYTCYLRNFAIIYFWSKKFFEKLQV